MKILFISPALPHAQAVSGYTVIHHRIRLLAKRGHQIGLACFGDERDAGLAEGLKPILHELEMLPRPVKPGYTRRIINHFAHPVPSDFRRLRSMKMMRTVGRMVQRSEYDLVIAEFTVMGQYLYRNPWLPAVRRIVSSHGSFTVSYQKALEVQAWSPKSIPRTMRFKGLEAFERAVYQNADRVLTLTPQGREHVLALAKDLSVSVVPYGVDVDRFVPGDPGDGVKQEDAIVFSGFFESEPNIDAAIWFAHSSWQRLRREFPELKLYLVGRAPNSQIEDLAKRDKRIIVTGEVESMVPYLRRAKVFICPMRLGTGFRGKILQAMSVGVPVVSTTLGAHGFPAHTGHNIMLGDTASTIASSIRLLLTDPGLHAHISVNAQELVNQRYSWTASVDRLEDVINEVVA